MKRTLFLVIAAAGALLLSPLAASRKSVLRRLDTTPAVRPGKHVRPNPLMAYAQETEPRKIGLDEVQGGTDRRLKPRSVD